MDNKDNGGPLATYDGAEIAVVHTLHGQQYYLKAAVDCILAEQTQTAGAARQGGITNNPNGAKMPCGAVVGNVYEAYEAGKSAALASQSQAVQPTIDTPEFRVLLDTFARAWSVHEHESEPGTWEAEENARAALIAHIAGTSQATKAQAEPKVSKDTDGNYTTGDEQLDLLLGLTEDMAVGKACPDTAIWWLDTLEKVLARLAAPVAKEAPAKRNPPSVVQNLLHWALKELLGALPERRDWFNPDAEKILRAVSEAGPVASVAKEATKEAESVQYMRNGDVKTWTQRAWEDGCDTDMQPDPKHYTDEMQEEIADLRAELARRFRAQGGITNTESGSDIAPTTSTVSAPTDYRAMLYKLVSTYFTNNVGENVYSLMEAARAHFTLGGESAGTQAAPEEVRNQALRPFAELAELFDDESRGSNMPGKDSDPVMQWPRLHKHYELTVGHLRAARDALRTDTGSAA